MFSRTIATSTFSRCLRRERGISRGRRKFFDAPPTPCQTPDASLLRSVPIRFSPSLCELKPFSSSQAAYRIPRPHSRAAERRPSSIQFGLTTSILLYGHAAHDSAPWGCARSLLYIDLDCNDRCSSLLLPAARFDLANDFCFSVRGCPRSCYAVGRRTKHFASSRCAIRKHDADATGRRGWGCGGVCDRVRAAAGIDGIS